MLIRMKSWSPGWSHHTQHVLAINHFIMAGLNLPFIFTIHWLFQSLPSRKRWRLLFQISLFRMWPFRCNQPISQITPAFQITLACIETSLYTMCSNWWPVLTIVTTLASHVHGVIWHAHEDYMIIAGIACTYVHTIYKYSPIFHIVHYIRICTIVAIHKCNMYDTVCPSLFHAVPAPIGWFVSKWLRCRHSDSSGQGPTLPREGGKRESDTKENRQLDVWVWSSRGTQLQGSGRDVTQFAESGVSRFVRLCFVRHSAAPFCTAVHHRVPASSAAALPLYKQTVITVSQPVLCGCTYLPI